MDPMSFHWYLNAWNKPQSKRQHAFRSSIRTDSNGIACSKWRTVRRGKIKEIVRYVINIYFSNRLKAKKAGHMPVGVIYHRAGNTKTNWEWSFFLCKVKLPLSGINRGANSLKLCRYESEMRHSTHDFDRQKNLSRPTNIRFLHRKYSWSFDFE